MTRAKKELYFTSAEDYGGKQTKKISRFLIEMGFENKSQNSKFNSQQNSKIQIPNFKNDSVPVFKKVKTEFLPQHFSYSQLAAFEKCPLQYKFGFILKVPAKGKAMFSFGKTMHNTLHEFLKQANESSSLQQESLFKRQHSDILENAGMLGFDELAKIYEKNWIDEWYETKKQKEEYYKLGKKIIKEFFEDWRKNQPQILKMNNSLALELPFNLKVGGHTLFGVIDRIDESDGGIKIIDYKTGRAKEKLDFEDKEQLLIYQIAAKEVLKLRPKELIYYYLEENKKVSFLGTDAEIKMQKEKILEEIERIKNSEFEPTPGWQCQFCDFKDICDFAQR